MENQKTYATGKESVDEIIEKIVSQDDLNGKIGVYLMFRATWLFGGQDISTINKKLQLEHPEIWEKIDKAERAVNESEYGIRETDAEKIQREEAHYKNRERQKLLLQWLLIIIFSIGTFAYITINIPGPEEGYKYHSWMIALVFSPVYVSVIAIILGCVFYKDYRKEMLGF